MVLIGIDPYPNIFQGLGYPFGFLQTTGRPQNVFDWEICFPKHMFLETRRFLHPLGIKHGNGTY